MTRCFQTSLSVWAIVSSGLDTGLIGSYKVVHVRRPQQVDSVVIGELGFVDIGAIGSDMGSIVDVVLRVDKADSCDPFPCPLCPVRIRRVACVSC